MGRAARPRRQGDVAECVVAMDVVGRRPFLAVEREPGTLCNRRVDSKDVAQMQAIARRHLDRTIAEAGGNADNSNTWRLVQEQQSHRVVDAGIRVENDLLHHFLLHFETFDDPLHSGSRDAG